MEVDNVSTFPQQYVKANLHLLETAISDYVITVIAWSHLFSACRQHTAINGKRSAKDHSSLNVFFAARCNSAESRPRSLIAVVLKHNINCK